MERPPTTPGEPRASAGFTLIELITVIALVAILAAIAVPNYRVAIIQSKEAVLKENLFRLRDLIDQYYLDKGQYPSTLETLVEDGYLRQLPKDPITQDADWTPVFQEPDPDRPGEHARRLRRQELLGDPVALGHAVQRMVNAVGGGMNSAPMRTVLALVLVAPLLTAGCAARWAYRQGQSASEMGDWDLAVARFTRALEKDPNNIGYKIALENARLQASRLHYDSARKALAANDFPKAAEELEIAVKFDPGNRSAADDLQLVRDRTRKAEEDKAERAEFEATRARAQAAARAPLPVLSPRSPVPITMKFESASLQKILESLGKIAGVNVLFDESFRDKRDVTVNLSGVTFQEALDRVTFVNRLFYKVLDQNTLIIVPESRQKRQAYDELLLRTFFVQNADINETVNLVKTLAKVQTVAGNQALNAITVLGTLDQIAMADRLIELNDKPRGEILVEVQILEVNRNAAKNWGINLSNYTPASRSRRRDARTRSRAACSTSERICCPRSTRPTGW